ncbi:MAG TPA: sulfotransferase family protein [Acidobacteria bacterium]|nr:sulfotransferase family protein [Acidobacteriota bacterium]
MILRRREEPVIVVSGLPRSGTSMAMGMLAAGGVEIVTDELRRPDEDNPKGYFELERVKDLAGGGDRSWLHEARGKAVKIISYLLQYLPGDLRYRVIFMSRDLDEVLASQARMLERRGEAPGDSPDRMRQRYVDHLASVRTILRLRPGFELLELNYPAVIEDPLDAAVRIERFLDRPLDTASMARAVDPSLYRNRTARPVSR